MKVRDAREIISSAFNGFMEDDAITAAAALAFYTALAEKYGDGIVPNKNAVKVS